MHPAARRLTGEETEELIGLARDYNEAALAKSAAEAVQDRTKSRMTEIMLAAGNVEVTAGPFDLSLAMQNRESIPVKLAREVLPQELLDRVLQVTPSRTFRLKVRRDAV